MMGYRIFLAGASGAIGSRLTPLLHSAGHRLRPIRRLHVAISVFRHAVAAVRMHKERRLQRRRV